MRVASDTRDHFVHPASRNGSPKCFRMSLAIHSQPEDIHGVHDVGDADDVDGVDDVHDVSVYVLHDVDDHVDDTDVVDDIDDVDDVHDVNAHLHCSGFGSEGKVLFCCF